MMLSRLRFLSSAVHPDVLTHSCKATSTPCRTRISRSYALRFILGGRAGSGLLPLRVTLLLLALVLGHVAYLRWVAVM